MARTPGPWKAWHMIGAGWQISTVDHADDRTRIGYGNVGGMAWHSGLSGGGPNPFERAQANAHLIAAAPDMYEALEATLYELEYRHGHWDDTVDETVDNSAEIARITTVLRKARGED